MINTKKKIIQYFETGIKDKKDFKIGAIPTQSTKVAEAKTTGTKV